MRSFGAIIFDFDGVLLESELEGNRHIAAILTELGHPTTVDEALDHFVGLGGQQFVDAIEARTGAALPANFHVQMKEASDRALCDGIGAVAGAIDFVQSLAGQVPLAVASSSSTRWLNGHLGHLGLQGVFGEHVYSGREHVARGKPAPDLYLHAAKQLGTPIADCVVIEDSRIGAVGALASGARVIGFAGGSHCRGGHADMLRHLGIKEVAHSFDDVRAFLD